MIFEQIIGAMLSMDMITKPEASVLTDMARAGNEYVTAALELYQSGMLCDDITYCSFDEKYECWTGIECSQVKSRAV
jgi:hypothetical protein